MGTFSGDSMFEGPILILSSEKQLRNWDSRAFHIYVCMSIYIHFTVTGWSRGNCSFRRLRRGGAL